MQLRPSQLVTSPSMPCVSMRLVMTSDMCIGGLRPNTGNSSCASSSTPAARTSPVSRLDPDPRSYRFGEQTAREITAGRTQPPPDGSLLVVRDLETAISVGASVAVRAHRDEQDVTVVCGRHTVTDGTAQRTLDTLAGVEPDRPTWSRWR